MMEGFLKEFHKVWETGILGTNLGDILTAFGLFIFFLFARRIVFRLFAKSLKTITSRTKTDLDDQLLEAI